MRRMTLHKKFILINIVIILSSVLGGAYISKRIFHYFFTQHSFFSSPVMIARTLIEKDLDADQEQLVKTFLNDEYFPASIWIFQGQNKLVFSNSAGEQPTLLEDFTFDTLKSGKREKKIGHKRGTVFFPERDVVLIYEDRIGKKFKPHLIWMGVLLTSILFGMSLLSVIVMYFVRKNVHIADRVMNELKRGNLKARFPVRKLDELGTAMSRFNSMADEIERLVEELRHADMVRINLLQELAHDLRTPVSSMKTMLETLIDNWDSDTKMSRESKKEFASLCLSEVNYFARLVEDLLFLARVSEPKYQLNTKELSVRDVIEHEVEIVESQAPDKDIILKEGEFSILGDAHLLGRLFRNALTNALRYAKCKVEISFDGRKIIIADDGEGFSSQVLEGYGERKFSRVMDLDKVSVGLGSVIMKRIAEIHRGRIQVKNNHLDGAQVEIIFD